MPYKQYTKMINGEKRYCIKNLDTGNETCYYSEKNRETGIKMREMYSHNRFHPKKTSTTVKKHVRKGRSVRKHMRRLR